MSNKIKNILIIIVVTIITIFFAYLQFNSIVKNTPSSETIYELDLNSNIISTNNLFNYLKDITLYPHEFSSQNNIEVKNKIINYLNRIGLNYFIQSDILTKEELYKKIYQEAYNEICKLLLDNDETNPNHYLTLDELFKSENNGMYETFDEYMLFIINGSSEIKYSSYEDYLKKQVDFILNNQDCVNINNIIIGIGKIDEKKDSIVVSVHYDSGLDLENKKPTSFGASDNGMNVAAAIECARLLKNNNFNNNVYIAIVNGEEVGFLGSSMLVESNIIKNIKLVLNFDNGGSSGNLVPWRYTNGLLINKYLDAVSNPHGTSASMTIWEQLKGDRFGGTDYDIYSKKYSVIDFALYMDNNNYHTKDDTFENISITSLENITKTMYELINYFGNDTGGYTNNDNYWFMELFDGLILKLEYNIYNIVVLILNIIGVLFLGYLFYKKKIISLIINIIFVIASIYLFFNYKDFSIICVLPVILNAVYSFIKNNSKVKYIIGISSYIITLYIFSILIVQLMVFSKMTLIMYLFPILYLFNILDLFKNKQKHLI